MVVMSGSEAIVETLIRNEMPYYFGVNSSEFLALTDVIYQNEKVSFISARHESNAALMADGYIRVTNKPAPVIGTNGPGVAHMYQATGAARNHGIPLILLVPGFARAELQNPFTTTKQLDQTACYKPITKAQFDVDSVAQIPGAINEAIRISMAGRPGPVIVSVVPQVYREKAEVTILPKAKIDPMHYDAEAVKAAAKILVNAKRPVLLYHERIFRYDLYSEARELAELLATPCIGEYRCSRGIVPEDTVLGFTGWLSAGAGMTTANLEAFSKADAVLALCCNFDNTSTAKNRPGSEVEKQIAIETKRIIQVDADPCEMSRRYPAEVEVLGNPKASIAALVAEIKRLGMDQSLRAERMAEAKKLKDRTNNAIEGWYNKLKNETPIAYVVVYKALQEILDRDAIQLHSGGTTNRWGAVMQLAKTPNSVHTDGMWHSLGQTFSMALGMKIAYPDRQVVNVIGDGSFWLCNASELETQKRLNLPVVTVILNNNIYGNMYLSQQNRFGGRIIGTEFDNPNFAELGKVFGFHSERVEKPEEVKPALMRALNSKRPAIIDIFTPGTTLPMSSPPVVI